MIMDIAFLSLKGGAFLIKENDEFARYIKGLT
jgi:hypothetical protein